MMRPNTDLLGELYQLIDRLSAARGLENVLKEVLSAAMVLTGSEMGTISPYRSSTQSFGEPLYIGLPDDYVQHMAKQREPVKGGPRERAFETRKRIYIPDVYVDPAFTPFLPWVRRAGFTSMQATPVFSRYGDPVGTICTFQGDHHVPSEEQLDLLDRYGKLAGDAIERENAESTLEKNEEGFRRLYELTLRLSAAGDLQSALDEVLCASIDLTEADAGHIRLVDPKTGGYAVAAQKGFKKDVQSFAASEAGDFFSHSPGIEAIEKGRRIVVEDLNAYPPLQGHSAILEALGFTSMQTTPLFNRAGTPIGSISTLFHRRLVPADGHLRLLDLYARLAADAIERVRTEDALRVSEERLRLATRGAKAYPWELDLQSNELWYTGDLEPSGAPPSGADFNAMLDLVHPEDRALVTRTFDEAQCGPVQFEFEIRPSDHSDDPSWFRISGESIKNQHGQYNRVVGIAQDITAHKSTEARLQKSEERFRRLYDLIVRLSGTSGPQGALQEVLEAVLEVLETDMGTIRLHRGKDENMHTVAASRGLPEDYLDYFATLPSHLIAAQPVVEALRTAKPVLVPNVYAHPSFAPHSVMFQKTGITSMLAWPLIDRGGKPVGAIAAMFSKETLPAPEQLQVLELYASLAADAIEREEQREEQVRTEQSLRQAIAVKDEFLGLVSHELRTPMTVIRGLSSVLTRNPNLPKDTLRETYRDLRVESDRLYRLIENMLALARVEIGQQRPSELALVDKTIEANVTLLRSELPDIVLKLNALPRDVTFQVVPQYFAQILHNLVENARKYSPPGSPIEVGATAEDDWVKIYVADHGIGVKQLAALFQPFSREEQAEKVATGMGLGLAVCKRLVEAQSGRIWAEPREGGGTVFCFTLPR